MQFKNFELVQKKFKPEKKLNYNIHMHVVFNSTVLVKFH